MPYPKEFSARVEAGEVHTAITRAIKYTLKPNLKRKRIDEISINAIRLKGIPKYEE